jgi:hypothetical protein
MPPSPGDKAARKPDTGLCIQKNFNKINGIYALFGLTSELRSDKLTRCEGC